MTFTAWNIPLSVMPCYYIACVTSRAHFFLFLSSLFQKSDLSGWRCAGRITIEAYFVGLRRWLLMLTSVGSCEDGPAHLCTVSSLNRALAPSSSGSVASLSFPLLSLSPNLPRSHSPSLSLFFFLFISLPLTPSLISHTGSVTLNRGLRDECSLCVCSFLARS